MHSLCSGCFVYFCLSTCFKILLTASTPFLSRGAAFPVFFQQTLRLGPALQWCHFGSPQVRPQPQENGKDYIGIYVFLLNKEKKTNRGPQAGFVCVGVPCLTWNMFTKFFSHKNHSFPHLTSRLLVRGTGKIWYFSHYYGDSEIWPLKGNNSELWLPFCLSHLVTETCLSPWGLNFWVFFP